MHFYTPWRDTSICHKWVLCCQKACHFVDISRIHAFFVLAKNGEKEGDRRQQYNVQKMKNGHAFTAYDICYFTLSIGIMKTNIKN